MFCHSWTGDVEESSLVRYDYSDSMREPLDPCCNIQLKTSFVTIKSSFMYPILECLPHRSFNDFGQNMLKKCAVGMAS